MPSDKKITQVAQLQEKVASAKSIAFAHYTGMNVASQQALRRAVKSAGGEVLIAKNRLMNIAMGKPEGLSKMLEQQVLTVFSTQDEVSAIKALDAFIKENEMPTVVGAYFENTVLDAQGFKRLAAMPGRSELAVQLLQRLQGPAYGLRNVVEAVPRNLVYALQAIVRKQEGNA